MIEFFLAKDVRLLRGQLSRREGVGMTSVDGMMLIRRVISGAKVHRGILCFLEETGKASYPRYDFLRFPSSPNSTNAHSVRLG